MVSTVLVSMRFSLIIVSLFAGAVLSQQCGHVAFLEHPGNVTVSDVGDTNITINCRLNSSRITVRWIHSLHNVEISTFGGNTFSTLQDLERFTQKTNITFSDGFFANLVILTVSPRHHGQYKCGLLNCDEFSYSGTVTVNGAVEMQFHPDRNVFNLTAGQNNTVEFRVFGAPEPFLNLFKQHEDDVYREITDNKFTLNLTAFSINSIQLEDAGSYRIWGNNTYGHSSLDFQINVKGVSPPIITLSETRITPPSYQTQINVTCSVPQTAYESELQLYWSFSNNNSRVSTSDSIEDLTDPSNITTNLFIASFSEIHNGNYTCHAMNSNGRQSSQVMLIGPPAKMNPPTVRGISNEPNQVRIEWTKPDSYGAALTEYIIKYSINTQLDNIEKNMTVIYNKSETNITDICIAGTWSFHIAAINEYGNTGDFSESILFNFERNCPNPPAKMNPPNVLGISSEPNQVLIQWTKPDSHGAALTSYIIKYSTTTQQGNIEKNMSVAHDRLQTSIKICIAGTWSFRIAAINEYGITGDFSEPSLFSIKINCPTKMNPPNVLGISNEPNQVLIQWTKPDSHGAALTSYIIKYSTTTQQGNIEKNMSVAHDRLQTSIKICIAGTWSFQIAATNEYGSTGDYSNPTLFNIGMNCPSPPAKMNPPNVLGISNEPNLVLIQWTKPDSHGAALTSYIIKYSTTTQQGNIEKNISVAHNHLLTSIKICIAGIWSFQIAATNEYGSTGDYSNPTLFNIRMNCPFAPSSSPILRLLPTTSPKSSNSADLIANSIIIIAVSIVMLLLFIM